MQACAVRGCPGEGAVECRGTLKVGTEDGAVRGPTVDVDVHLCEGHGRDMARFGTTSLGFAPAWHRITNIRRRSR